MRICSIVTSFTSGGAEVLVTNLARSFAAAGHRPSVVALSNAAQVGNSPETEALMMARVREAGGTAQSMGLANRNSWLRGAFALNRVLRSLRPDVIHSHTARALPLIAMARLGVPVVLTHHNSRLSFPPAAFHLFNQLVHGYVAISDQCEALLRQHAWRPVHRIANAADPRFRATEPREWPAKDPVILAVGTVSEQKDYPTLIRAAALASGALRGQGRRARIRIAGAGPMLAQLQALIAAEGAGGSVELLGARSDVDILMREADLFVNCSLWEGFPIALIEAAMSGLPIVATDVAGNKEMVEPGVNGLLVPPSDPQALADAIVRALSDGERYRTMSQGALASARRFSIDGCAEAHLTLYASACGQVERRAGIATVAPAE